MTLDALIELSRCQREALRATHTKSQNANQGADMAPRYVSPLDPECPAVAAFHDALHGDPMTAAMGAPVDDIEEAFARKHRAACARCQEYGAANVDVES
jgi:hypothetical protein